MKIERLCECLFPREEREVEYYGFKLMVPVATKYKEGVMKVLAMMVFVVMMMVACYETKDVTSGELWCDAFLNCEETKIDEKIPFDECVKIYDSNPCIDGVKGKKGCFIVFTDSEKDCLMEFSQCDILINYESCLE